MVPGTKSTGNGARHHFVGALVVLAIVACGAHSPAAPDGAWQLTWADEFDQADGSAPSAAKWVDDTGGGGWGNDELETYTERRENSFVRGGSLVIKAAKERFTGADGIAREYTSARLKTLGTFAQAYGRFEARMKLPRGQGIWPAFWMLGDDSPQRGGRPAARSTSWRTSAASPRSCTARCTVRATPARRGRRRRSRTLRGAPFADDFHVFAIEWEPSAIRWYVDGTAYATRTPSDLPGRRTLGLRPSVLPPVERRGGRRWPGNPDATTTFPQELVVDWVRVYKR